MIVDTLSTFCIRHEIIKDEDLPLFRYCIEKRLYSAIVLLPLFLLGVMWTNLATTLAFLGSFSYLRSTTNGFHTKKPGTCFICSIFIEFLLFEYVIPHLTPIIVFILLIASILSIILLAPFNHSNMDLAIEEIEICRTMSRKRMVILLVLLLFSTVLSWTYVSIGLLLGVALVSVLLCLAYIIQ